MDLVLITLVVSSSLAAATGYDLRWDAAIWCVDLSYRLGVCESRPGRADACDVELVDRCLRVTGADEAVPVQANDAGR